MTVVMDRLVVTITPGANASSVIIDNIAVTAATVSVPEPAALALSGSACSASLPWPVAARRCERHPAAPPARRQDAGGRREARAGRLTRA